jgi:putative aldouronate transport system permease protein
MSSALDRFPPVIRKRKGRLLLEKAWKERWLYILMLPGIIYFLVYKYLPMAGIVIAFQDYMPRRGVLGSDWVGAEHFIRFFTERQFWQLFRNTLILALYSIIFYFPVPIVLALLLNEVTRLPFKRFVQSVTYLPHFLSWVVIVGITRTLLNSETGLVNQLIEVLGGEPVQFLISPVWFRPMIVMQDIWKDAGWGSILFLAALAGVDPQLYESAVMEGANRWQQLWHITLPSIMSTIVIIFILRLGRFLDLRLEQILLMVNALNREVGDVFDTYVYRTGILQAQYSYSAAVGMFRSVVGLLMVILSNWTAHKMGQEGIY